MVIVIVVASSILQHMFRCKNSCGCCSVTRQKTSDQAPIRYYYCTDIDVAPHTRDKTRGSGIRLRYVTVVSPTSSTTYSFNSSNSTEHSNNSIPAASCFWVYVRTAVLVWSLETYSSGKKQLELELCSRQSVWVEIAEL